MQASYIDQLSRRIENIEASFIPESWRRKFRQALIPVLLMYGCGTQDQKKEDEDQGDPQEETGPISLPGPTTQTPKSGTTFNPKGLEEQLNQRGWGCSITLSRPTAMTWKFTKLFPEERGVRRNRDSFSILFVRDSEDSPWDFANPRNIQPAYSGTPEMESLQKEVLDSLEYGAKYIATKYDCYVGNPRGTNID